ncbi:NYN domain-containing protein [Candidatus Uhrbacteria bacterium]|nr:NYN domain-containing protein [Candidatus Uhrbacteria bacterium]
MMIQRPDQRVAVFIDTQNMYHSAKHVFNSKVSFSALVEAVVGSRMMSRAIAYVAKSKGGDESAFFEALLASGIELKIKDVQEFASGAKKADWDVGMAVDAISISSKVDVVILATGDGDFVPLVEYLKAHGVICEVAAFAESTNARLKEVADAFLDLSSEPERFLIGYRGRGKAEKEESGKQTRRKGNSRRESPPEDNGASRIRITH